MKQHTTKPATYVTAHPQELAQSAVDAVRDIFDAGTAANTTRSYSTALRYWASWYQCRYGAQISMPVSPETVVQFIVDHVARRPRNGHTLTWELPADVDRLLVGAGMKKRGGPFKLSTVTHRIAVLSAAHQARKLDNPCETPQVRSLLAKGRRAASRRGERTHKKTAITRVELEAMVATCDGSLEGLRDRAILYFTFASGGRRRSETAAARIEDLRRVPGGYVYRLEHEKTMQEGPKATSTPDKPIMGKAGEALGAWLAAARIDEGAIFRRLWKNRVGQSITAEAIALVVTRRAKLAGLEGDFGGHSLRSGFVTECGRQNIPLAAVMSMTGHRAVATVVGYHQAGAATENPASRILEDDD